jgi:hypothetical protein
MKSFATFILLMIGALAVAVPLPPLSSAIPVKTKVVPLLSPRQKASTGKAMAKVAAVAAPPTITLTWSNNPNCWYVLETCTNLAAPQWVAATNILPAWPSTVTLPRNLPAQFYRIGIKWTNNCVAPVYWSTNS